MSSALFFNIFNIVKMKTVSQSVEEIIKKKPFLESALSQGIINMTSLAKDILPQVEKDMQRDINQGAIVMAIKRLAPTLEFQINHKIRYLCLKEISAMKLEVIGFGGRKKDFWDIHELLETFTLDEMIGFHQLRCTYGHTKSGITSKLIDFSRS